MGRSFFCSRLWASGDTPVCAWVGWWASSEREHWLIGCWCWCGHGQPVRSLLICRNGCAPYPKSTLRALRSKVKGTGEGQPCLEVWPKLMIGQVVKHQGQQCCKRNQQEEAFGKHSVCYVRNWGPLHGFFHPHLNFSHSSFLNSSCSIDVRLSLSSTSQ